MKPSSAKIYILQALVAISPMLYACAAPSTQIAGTQTYPIKEPKTSGPPLQPSQRHYPTYSGDKNEVPGPELGDCDNLLADPLKNPRCSPQRQRPQRFLNPSSGRTSAPNGDG